MPGPPRAGRSHVSTPWYARQMRRTCIGLDIGPHAVRLACVEASRNATVVRGAQVAALPSGSGAPERIVLGLLQDLGALALPCVIGVGGATTMLQALSVPASDPRSVGQVLDVEIGRLSDLAGEPMIHSAVRLPPKGGTRRVLLALSRPHTVAAALRVPQALGLDVVDALPGPAALLHTLQLCGEAAGPPTVCAEIGAHGTDLAVVGQGRLLFARRFDVDAARPAPNAEHISRAARAEQGEAPDPGECAGSAPVEAPLREAWISEFRTSITLYREIFPADAERPVRLLLCGEHAARVGAAQELPGILDMQVGALPAPPGLEGRADAGLLATAVGLAAAGLRAAPSPLSLLPGPMKEARALHAQKKYWLAGTVAAALLMGVLVAGERAALNRRTARLETLRTRLAISRMLERDLADIKAENERLARRSGTARRVAEAGLVMQAVIDAAARAKDSKDWITLVADSGSYFAPAAGTESDTDQPAPEAHVSEHGVRSLVIEGYTPRKDLSYVRRMIAQLREHPLVAQADLLGDDRVVLDPSREARWERTGCHRFAMEVTVRE